MRSKTVLAILAALLAIALAAATAVAVQRSRQLDRVRGELEELREQVEETPGRPGDDEDGGGGARGLLESLGAGMQGAACLTGGGADGLPGAGAEPAPGEPQPLVDHIAAEVARLRELEQRRDIDADLLSARQMTQRVTELFLEEYSAGEIETEQRLLTALGALEEGTDLKSLYRELLGAQVAGFYVPETGQLVIRDTGGGLGPSDQVVLAHEIDHALTDQVLDLPPGEDDQPDADGGDAATDRELAAAAVAEGDASLVMQQWAMSNLDLADQLQLATDPAALAAAGDLEQAPYYLARKLIFPYLDGLDFVCQIHQRGGWSAVDGLYEDPPVSSAQVMFPQRYLSDQAPADPPALTAPDGWRERGTDSFGAAQLSWLLEAPGGDRARSLSDVRSRVGVWAGGTATVWEEGPDTAVGLSLVARGDDDPPLCATVTEWYAAAFPGAARSGGEVTRFDGADQDAVVRCRGRQVSLGVAPGMATARAVAG